MLNGMSQRDVFEQSELDAARSEESARLVRVAAYKADWRRKTRLLNIDAARAKDAAYMREWREKNRLRAREISRAGSAKYVAQNPATRRKSARDHNARRRSELMAFFGGACVRCGFSDSRALHLDHIHGNGNQIRAKGGHGLHEKWKMTRDNPNEARSVFQLLCANCNNIKRFEDYEYAPKARLRKAAGL